MKKLLFVVAFGVSGWMCAASPDDHKIKRATDGEKSYESALLFRIEYGMGAIDTADGTCFVYGTYIYGDNGSSMFVPASQATQSTYVINCTGSHNYMA